MTPDFAARVARQLGVKPTAAEPRSEMFEAWRDRVALAWERQQDWAEAQLAGDPSDTLAALCRLRDAAIADANAYAIGTAA